MELNGRISNAVRFVAIANLLYFGVEFYFALKGNSISLFADSIDFLEDASINFLILIGLGWSAHNRAKLGMFLATIIMIPAVVTVWKAIDQFLSPTLPSSGILSFTGTGALAVNIICTLILVRYRDHKGSLVKAAFLSSRNDVAANIAIIAAGIMTRYTHSFWPDLIVGIAIAALNADAAKEVWEASRDEIIKSKA